MQHGDNKKDEAEPHHSTSIRFILGVHALTATTACMASHDIHCQQLLPAAQWKSESENNEISTRLSTGPPLRLTMTMVDPFSQGKR